MCTCSLNNDILPGWSMIVMYFQHAASRRGICHVLGLVDGAPWGGTHRASPIYEALFSASALAVCKILGMPGPTEQRAG